MPVSTPPQRQIIVELFLAGVSAADPYLAVQSCLRASGAELQIGLDRLDTGRQRRGIWPRVHIIAFGKAACAMAAAAQKIIPPEKQACPGISVTTYDNLRDVDGFKVIGAGHPLPDAAGLDAARLIAARATAAQAGELVLALVSGGGSALLPLPVAGISLAEKIATTNLLLACGANIQQMNTVRKHLSQLKGGGLARMTAPAELHALILSDVIGDELSAIASGPTVADASTFGEAIEILKSFQIWSQIPLAVQNHLLAGLSDPTLETPKADAGFFGSTGQTLIGSNAISIEAVIAAAKQAYRIEVFNRQLCGEAREVAAELAAYAAELLLNDVQRPIAIIAGGETTVTLGHHQAGKGGRNQEMALAFAVAAENQGLPADWLFLSGGTDGRDGPTDAAGGVVDSQTLHKIRLAGLDPTAMLDNHDAYPALQAADALLMTGATGTNVADIQILLLHPFS